MKATFYILFFFLLCVSGLAQDTVYYQKKVIIQGSSRLELRNNYQAVFFKDSVKIENKNHKNFKQTANSLFIFKNKSKTIYYERK